MATTELELYYERKLRLAMDTLDELDRIELDPNTSAQERENVKELKPGWQREYALARSQYAGIRSGQSTLPLPSSDLRKKIAKLCDEVEKQVNANKAAEAGLAATAKFAETLKEIRSIA